MKNAKTESKEKKMLHQLSATLKSLHKDLLQFQARHAEEFDEQKYSAYHLLHLCLHDDRFLWLRNLSSLITQIDHRVHDEEEVEILDLQSIYDEAWGLLHNSIPDFSQHYNLALSQDPHLYMKQADVLSALQELQPFARSMHEMHVINEENKMKGP